MNTELDERQLYLRGKTYRNGFILLLSYLLVDAFFESKGIRLVEGMWGNILAIVVACAYGMIDMVMREVVDLENISYRFAYNLLGFLGFVLFILNTVHLIIRDESFFVTGSLSEYGARWLFSLAWVLVGATWFYKLRSVKQQR